MKTMSVKETAIFLKLHWQTVRKMVSAGQLPGAKVGKEWRFYEPDLVEFLRSRYVKEDSNVIQWEDRWRSSNATKSGGLTSITKIGEYEKALGLKTD